LGGYLLVAKKLLEGQRSFAEAWNFGPDSKDNLSVAEVINQLQLHWPILQWQRALSPSLHETAMLYLDNSKSKLRLGWNPVWNLEQGLRATAEWYRQYLTIGECISRQQLADYSRAASERAPSRDRV